METIRSKKEFERVFRGGQRANHRLVRLTALQDGCSGGKLAFVAPRRLGNAVYRNRCKRVLREAARIAGLPMPGSRIILFATAQTYASSPSEVAQVLPRLVERAVHHGVS